MNEFVPTPYPLDSPPLLQGLRVLVVDDLAASCDTLAMLLELDGAQVQTATSGACALVQALQFLPQAVVLDLGLPDIDGLQVAIKMRQMPALQDCLLVALSGYKLQGPARAEDPRVFDASWVKPADSAELVRFLAHAALRARAVEK